jgi:hypothetical protein
MLKRLKVLFLLLVMAIASSSIHAIEISGIVKDEKNQPVSFCSVQIKNTKITTLTNTDGKFSIELTKGNYTLIFQHLGFEKLNKVVEITDKSSFIEVNLVPNEITLQEIVVKSGGEDPAYEIIRRAIEKRKYHKDIVENLQCESYIKGLIKLKDFPKKFFGQNVDFEDGDTSKQKTIFLSETFADIYFTSPDDIRINVKSTKVSGQSNGLGFSNPQIISFYDNNIMLSKTLNPRGFISPIADGAIRFYTYKYIGVFFENGKQVSKIEVKPKRNWEPLFTGYIQIVENEWTIHSLRLSVKKESQLEFADKVIIEQMYLPFEKDIWLLSTQTIYPEINFFGFDASGYFISLFSNYIINQKKISQPFGRTILKFDADANKKNLAYWDSVRPIPLLLNEIADYKKKDSLEKRKEDPAYLDSLDKIQNKISSLGVILTGQAIINRNKKSSYSYDPLLKSISFNNVEGWVGQFSGTYNKRLKNGDSYSIIPVARFGTSNFHLNPFIVSRYRFKNHRENDLKLSFGKKVFQFNNANPVPQIMNTVSTLFRGNNYLKIYEAEFIQGSFRKEIFPGLTIEPSFSFQNRSSLENKSNLSFWGDKSIFKNITPNYPVEANSDPLKSHKAFSSGITIRFRPNTKLIELPDRTINVNSKSPFFVFEYRKGIDKIFGSNVKYDRWNFSIIDDMNFKIGGEFRYRISIGGFLDKSKLEFPDYHHLAGNLTRNAAPYLQTFQIAPFYKFSNKEKIHYALFTEYKLNGLLTNKIPVLKKLNLRLITGTNMIYLERDKLYNEIFLGFDNVLKILRLDYVIGFQQGKQAGQGLRIGIKGFSSLFTDY